VFRACWAKLAWAKLVFSRFGRVPQQGSTWVDMQLHESYNEGGFSVCNNTITCHYSSDEQTRCPPPLHAQSLAQGPLAAVQLHQAVCSGTACAAVRRRQRRCCQLGHKPAASHRLPGQQQAPPTATQPPSFGIQEESGVPLGVFQLVLRTSRPNSPQSQSSLSSTVSLSSSPRIGRPSRTCVSTTSARGSRSSSSFTSPSNTRPLSLTPLFEWR
jgi:hypothetical protein